MPSVETTTDSNLAGNLTLASNYAGYTTYNWYESSTTASNLYVGAYGGNSPFSISFHVGHGDITGWMCFTGGPHYHTSFFMRDDSGNAIKDNQIYDNSVDENPNGKKMVYIWSCHLGEDAMGEIVEYPCGDEERGMPLAWIHDDGLNLDGYSNPDNSGQVFIGFDGYAYLLSDTVWDVEEMGFMFVRYFYWATLCDGATINGALNVASNALFGVTYGNCNLDNGYILQQTLSHMIVCGQGTMYI